MHFLIYLVLFYIVNGLAFFKAFQKAGKQGWEAFVPVYNEITILKIIENHLSGNHIHTSVKPPFNYSFFRFCSLYHTPAIR